MAKIDGTSSKNGYGFYAIVEEVIPSNYTETLTTTVNYSVYIVNGNTRFNSNNWTKKVRIDGEEVYSEIGVNIDSTTVGYGQPLLIMQGSKNILHNNDGSKTINFEAYIEKSSYSTYDPGKCELNGDIVLTTIPRESTVRDFSALIGSTYTITVLSNSNSFRHKLEYTFGNLQGVIAENVGTSYDWQIPTSFYTQMPNNTIYPGTIKCTTYNNGQQVGQSKTTRFEAFTNEQTSRPDVSLSLATTDDLTYRLTGVRNKIIKYVSRVQATITATPRNSSTISGVNISCTDGQQGSANTVYFDSVQGNGFTAFVTDSRGYSNSTYKALDMVDYKLMTFSANVYRPSPTGSEAKVQISGTFFNGSFGATTNSITIKYRMREKGGTYPTTYTNLSVNVSGNNYSADISLGTSYNYKKNYEFEFIAYDKVIESTPITIQDTLSQGVPILGKFKNHIEAWGKKIFEVTSDEKVRFNLDLIYPVGSIYINVNSTNPNTLFGGTWQRLDDRFLIGAGNSYAGGATGGSTTVTLNTNQIPSHSHSYSGTTSENGEHTHTGHTQEVKHPATSNNTKDFVRNISSSYDYDDITITDPAGKHTHTFSGTTGATGGTQSHSNMPPYLAVYIWKRTA